MKILEYKSDELHLELAKHIISYIIRKFLNQDKVVIALSGGNTPKPTYRLLGKYLCSEEILGENRELHIIQVDERLTSSNSDRSNQKMIKKEISCEINSLFYHFMPTEEDIQDVDEAAKHYNSKLESIIKNGIDLILLGMGSDGHTASLFPFNNIYVNSLNSSDAVIGMFVKEQNENRMSLSPSIIKNSKDKILLITGKEKMSVLNEAIRSDNYEKYPIKLALEENILVFTDSKMK